MTFNDYQALAKTTAIYPEQVKGVYPLLGLYGETMETIEKAVGNFNVVVQDCTAHNELHLGRALFIMGTTVDRGKEVEQLKKHIRKNGLAEGMHTRFVIDSEEDITELKKELGDILWYMSAICTDFGISLEDVAQTNYDKLKSRMERNVIEGSGDNR